MEKQKADSLITEYLPKLYGFAMKKSFSYDEAEDLCADIVKEVYSSLRNSQADGICNLEGYIWRISEHTYSKYVASKKKHQGVSIDGMEFPFYDEYALGEAEEEMRMLRREIAFLTKKRRRIVYSFYYENKSVSSISREMGMPEGTVKWHLNKARNELKEGFSMERKIGKLGMAPVEAISFDHNGKAGSNGGAELYLNDKLNLNIVYSVYFSPKTREEIAEELGMTLVYIEDRIELLETNGFLVKTDGNRYTTYVIFDPVDFSLEWEEKVFRKKMEIAEVLVNEYVPAVRAAAAQMKDVYIPGGNRELFEAAAIFFGVTWKCGIPLSRDTARYTLKTTDGGEYEVWVKLPRRQTDPDYKASVDLYSCWMNGSMTRSSVKYPAVASWSVDTRYSTRVGGYRNNQLADYEYLYEYLSGTISENTANAEKFQRLRERKFLTEDDRVNIMIVNEEFQAFAEQIPSWDESLKQRFVNEVLELAMVEAKRYPPQIQDWVIGRARNFVSVGVPVMVMDILYGNGTFRALTEQERITSNLLMFSDVLP